MSLTPLFEAGPVVAVHALLALLALGLGASQLALAKGGERHRIVGWIWVAAMVVVAASGFFIHSIRLIGPFSPIHLLSAITLFSLYRAVAAARAGELAAHERWMKVLFFLALVLTGAFTLFPGRVMFEVVFGA